MSQERQEQLIDLLIKKAIRGLDEMEQQELESLDPEIFKEEFRSLELTAAAISIAEISSYEPLPSHLYSKIAADADQYVEAVDPDEPWLFSQSHIDISEESKIENHGLSVFGWLGWATAVAACLALVTTIWLTRPNSVDQARIGTPSNTIQVVTTSELRSQMMNSSAAMIKADWTAGNMKEMKISGDVVWSDEKQKGYMRIEGLPVNDDAKETYQLWIFDKAQDKATPIDGGIFDVPADGEIVIPINAKLKAKSPEMFAITIEKPGGVVVSKREKLAAIAKVENRVS